MIYASVWAFDIDGVIADTRDAVKESYRIAGVTQPDDVWGISWKLWLPALTDEPEAVHTLKQEYYEKILASGGVKRLPGADIAQALKAAGHTVAFVTSASQRSARGALSAMGLPTASLMGWELSYVDRVRTLQFLSAVNKDAVYFTYVDDREEGARIAADAGWLFTHAQWTQ